MKDSGAWMSTGSVNGSVLSSLEVNAPVVMKTIKVVKPDGSFVDIDLSDAANIIDSVKKELSYRGEFVLDIIRLTDMLITLGIVKAKDED